MRSRRQRNSLLRASLSWFVRLVQRFGWMAASIALVSALTGWLIARHMAPEPNFEARPVRFTVQPPDNTDYREGRVSPDGRWLAFIGIDTSGVKQLWVQALDSLSARPLGRAEFTPFWSPDSRFIAFGQDGKLKRIDVAGGPPQTICDATLIIGGSWNQDGIIIFGSGTGTGGPEILQVPASGGVARRLTVANIHSGENQHTFPVFLPDGQHFLYTIQSAKTGDGGIYLGSLRASRKSAIVC